MKRIVAAAVLLLSVVASDHVRAADMPIPSPYAPPPDAAPVFNTLYDWRGLYVGLNGGYVFGTSAWSDPSNLAATSSGNFRTDGFLAGGTLGGNFQSGALVFGIEGDIDWQGLKGSSTSAFCTSVSTTPGGGAAGLNCRTQSDWLITARGRIGYAFDRVLLFATGGIAMTDVQAGLSALPFQISLGQIGWAAGGGVEIGLAGTWTAKVEYLYVNFASASCNVAANCGFDPTVQANDQVKFSESIVRAGVNFKFTP